jgi:hypothetical protein
MKQELDPGATREALFAELNGGLESAVARIRAIPPERMSEPRLVGRQQLPTTVAGLVIHVGDHAQRHVGQGITTAKIIKSRRSST